MRRWDQEALGGGVCNRHAALGYNEELQSSGCINDGRFHGKAWRSRCVSWLRGDRSGTSPTSGHTRVGGDQACKSGGCSAGPSGSGRLVSARGLRRQRAPMPTLPGRCPLRALRGISYCLEPAPSCRPNDDRGWQPARPRTLGIAVHDRRQGKAAGCCDRESAISRRPLLRAIGALCRAARESARNAAIKPRSLRSATRNTLVGKASADFSITAREHRDLFH